MTEEPIEGAAETTRFDLRGLAGTLLAIKATGVKRDIPGPPPNEATTCVVLNVDVTSSGYPWEESDVILSEDHYMFWRNVRNKLRVGYWIVGRITKGHTAWILEAPRAADDMEHAKVAIGAYNSYKAKEANP